MATTPPAATATSPASPATRTRPASPPLPPRQGSMTFVHHRLSQPLELEQVVRDPTWDKFKTVMVFLGGIAILAWLAYGSFQAGANTTTPRPAVSTTIQSPPVVQPPPAPPKPADNSVERERRFKEYLRSQDR